MDYDVQPHVRTLALIDYLVENPRVRRAYLDEDTSHRWAVQELCEIVAAESHRESVEITLAEADLSLADPELEQRVWVHAMDEGPATKINLLRVLLHRLDLRG